MFKLVKYKGWINWLHKYEKQTLYSIKQTTCRYMTESHVYYRTHLIFHVPTSSGLSYDSIHLWFWFEKKKLTVKE